MSNIKISLRLTACESCRKLKRKCDFLKSEGGPCSNCKMRNIGHLCSFGKDLDSAKRTSSTSSSSSNLGTASASPSENYNPKRLKIDESDIETDNKPNDEPLATVNTHTRLPVKFLSSCVVRFSKSPEMSYYLDLDQLITTVADLGRPSAWNGCNTNTIQKTTTNNTGSNIPIPDNHPPTPPSPQTNNIPPVSNPAPDLASIALLYIVCATVIVRRGAKVSPSSNFSGTREQLARELVEIHERAIEQVNTISLTLVQALMVRAQFHSIIDQSEIGWEVLKKATKLFDQLPLPSSNEDYKYALAYNASFVNLGYLESTICVYANKSFIWTDRILNFRLDDDTTDFRIRRRLTTLQYMRRIQLIINQPLDATPTYEEQDSLEQEILDYIAFVDVVEGMLLPYGQMFLLISLVKLRTHMLMRLVPDSDPDGLIRNKYLARLSEHGHRIIKYLELVTRMWYSGNSRRSSVYFLGSSQFLAVHLFHGLTCLWILSALTRNEPDGAVFEEIREKIWHNIERLREDMRACRRTHVLFKGIDFLSGVQKEGSLSKIPAEFHSGIDAIAKRWNDSLQEQWMDFQSTFDDSLLWSFIISQSTFDDSLGVLLPNSEEPIMLS